MRSRLLHPAGWLCAGTILAATLGWHIRLRIALELRLRNWELQGLSQEEGARSISSLGPDVADLLAEIVDDDLRTTRRIHAIAALGQVGSPTAWRCLAEASSERNQVIRAEALRALKDSLSSGRVEAAFAWAKVMDDPVVCLVLIETLRRNDDARRHEWARHFLAKTSDFQVARGIIREIGYVASATDKAEGLVDLKSGLSNTHCAIRCAWRALQV